MNVTPLFRPIHLRVYHLKFMLVSACVLFWLTSCEPKPEALQYNKDACQFCKMTLVDKRFGAEIVTTKGKVYKFDDANCMINFMNSSLDDREIAFKLIVDYTQPEKFITANEAFYLKSDTVHSPMNSHIAAFESYSTLEQYKKKWNAIYLSWGELTTQFK